jgi:hypothetical protein
MRSVLLCFLIVFGLLTSVHGQQPKSISNSIGMKLILIHPGSFTMGSPPGGKERQDYETVHEVEISESYYLGAFEVIYQLIDGTAPASRPDTQKRYHHVSRNKWPFR